LKKVAGSQNMSIKDVVLSTIHDFSKHYKLAYSDGFRDALKLFYDKPRDFYVRLVAMYPNAEEVALFTAPCSICGKPIVFTHKDSDWAKEVKPTLHQAFDNWQHVCCGEVEEGKRKSCPHLLRGLG
jgi:hypothetical protein